MVNLAFGNYGNYVDDKLSCQSFHQMFENHMIVGDWKFGKPVGEHKVYTFKEETVVAQDKVASKIMSLSQNQNIDIYGEYGTDPYEKKYSFDNL